MNLILNTEDYITGNELAKLCNVTLRTIRRDIKKINESLNEYDAKITSNLKKGYFLNKKSKDILKKNNVIRKVLDYEYIIEVPNSPLDRQMYILLKLTAKNHISLEELEKTLYVSEATINNDVVLMNKWLKNNLKLRISYSLNKGFTLKANEIEKRNIISWVLAIRLNISSVLKYWNYLFYDEAIISNARAIYLLVNIETKKYGYFLSGHSAQLLCYEILVAINRNNLGFNLNSFHNTKDKLIPIMAAIREKLEMKLNINLPEADWLNLQQSFKSKQFLRGTAIKNLETKEADFIVNKFFLTLKEKFNIDLSTNPDNKYKLILYLSPMINRLKYMHCIPNSIDEKIIQIYKAEFKMALELNNIVKEILNLDIKIIDLAYITIHLVSMCGLWKYKFKTILVCDYDESIIDFIMVKIKNHFTEKLEITRCYDYQEFMYEKKEKLKEVELIITTSTIADITDIPFIRISPEIEQNDLAMIKEYLDTYTKVKNFHHL